MVISKKLIDCLYDWYISGPVNYHKYTQVIYKQNEWYIYYTGKRFWNLRSINTVNKDNSWKK